MSYKHILSTILIFICWFSSFAQDFSQAWTGYFSYLEIKDISQGSQKIFVASENAIFSYDIYTDEIETISSIEGMSGETITALLYVEERNLIIIGFENGLLQVYNEIDKTFLSVVDILEKTSIPSVDKVVNHLFMNENLIYISTDYGISVYNIDALEFGDTYYIGPNGSQLEVRQTTVLEGNIYAATAQRLYKAQIANPNLIDYQEWESLNNGNWIGIQNVEGVIYAATANRRVYELVNDNPIQKIIYPQTITGFKTNENKLIVTINKQVFVYDSLFNQLATTSATVEYNSNFSKSISIGEDIYVGTNRIENVGQEAFGVLKASYYEPEIYNEIHPSSPLLNRFFKVKYQEGQIWGTHGGYSINYNPFLGQRRFGLSHFVQEEWVNINYQTISEAVNLTVPLALSNISIDPYNTSEVYVSSSRKGVVFLNDGEVNTFFNDTNSTIIPFLGANFFVFASNFDEYGNYWVMNGRYERPLNRLSQEGQWQSYNFNSLINPPDSNLGFSSIIFDDSDTVFIGSSDYGLIACVPDSNNPTIVNISSEEDGMPSPNVRALAIDRNGQLWLGLDKGLRVVYNTQSFLENPEVDNIVVLDNGEASELLYQQFITDIEVDGSNNKWIATLDTGLYYFSSDGQQTIFHFTKDNSPLPSNDILDVALDEVNGIVYIATENGLLSFKSDASKPKTTLEDAFVFPNPVRPTFDMVTEKIKIRDISENVNIKITDIEGNLVAEAESNTNGRFKGYNLEIDGGTALWNGKNLAGDVVASGVYLVMLNDLDTLETKVLKLMVVR
ncbi:two-component regulator propeller domain-containing protein [Mesoflavibacter sp. CH_XMU1404-2]|uniref:type IX secretion system anionic LPS delivery protein PorZ n=1 Tax=Mesoflavibacter sp. CH_XMU1404-2 TaxID=3107766 RepID=UPI00300B8265